jgi:hypothetical protein
MSSSDDEDYRGDCRSKAGPGPNVLLSRAHALVAQLHANLQNLNLSQRQFVKRSVEIMRQLSLYKDDSLPYPSYFLIHGPTNTPSDRVIFAVLLIRASTTGGSSLYQTLPFRRMLISTSFHLGAYGKAYAMGLHPKATGDRRAIGLVEGIDGSNPTEDAIVEVIPPENANKPNGGDLVNPPRTNANKTLADKGFIGNMFDLNAKYPYEVA